MALNVCFIFHRTILTTNEENMHCYTRKYRSPGVKVLQLRERQLTVSTVLTHALLFHGKTFCCVSKTRVSVIQKRMVFFTVEIL